jgi:hypothetical protein
MTVIESHRRVVIAAGTLAQDNLDAQAVQAKFLCSDRAVTIDKTSARD